MKHRDAWLFISTARRRWCLYARTITRPDTGCVHAQISFQNTGSSSINFCLDEIELTGGSPPSHLTSLPASPQGGYPGPVTPNIAQAVTS